jgi:hypothetical protein
MTLRRLKVDDTSMNKGSPALLPVPFGWSIAEGDADDLRVCAAHAWQVIGIAQRAAGVRACVFA